MIEGDGVGHGHGSGDGVGRGFASVEVGHGLTTWISTRWVTDSR